MSQADSPYFWRMPVNMVMIKAALKISESLLVAYGATDFGIVSSMQITDWQGYVNHDEGVPSSGVKVKVVSLEDETVELPVNQVGTK